MVHLVGLYCITLYYAFNLFNHFKICILTLLLHIYDINSHYCILLCWIPPWEWLKKAETCRRNTYLYFIASNYSGVVGIYRVTCLTAQNMNNFKVRECPQSITLLKQWCLWLSSDSKFITIFKKNFEYVNMWNVPFHILCITHCKFCSIPQQKIYSQS